MIKSMLLAASVSLAIVSTAGAVTPPTKPGATVSSDLVQVKRRWHDGWRWNKRKHWRHNYNRRHYGHPPRGWNRYDRRPWGWKRRGCLSIGPVWYCP